MFKYLTKSKSAQNKKLRPLLIDINRMLDGIEEKKIELIRRIANTAADWIAKQSKEGMSPF